jgi:hypothetical protein
MWLLLIALFGFVVPNGFFIYWLLVEFAGSGPSWRTTLHWVSSSMSSSP